MSNTEYAIWMFFIFIAVVSVHPIICVLSDKEWLKDYRSIWIRCKKLPSWIPCQRLFNESANNIAKGIDKKHIDEYHIVKMKAWASFFRKECSFIEAIKIVEKWSESKR
jgi:hypothetical protein